MPVSPKIPQRLASFQKEKRWKDHFRALRHPAFTNAESVAQDKCRLYLHNVHASQRMRKAWLCHKKTVQEWLLHVSQFLRCLFWKKQGGQPNQRPPVSKWWRRRSFSTGVIGLSGGCKCENIGSSKMLSSPGVKTLGPRRHFMWFHKGLGKGLKVKGWFAMVFGKHPSTN